MSFSFNAVKLCIAIMNEKRWTRAKEACMALEYKRGRKRDVLKKHVSIENKQHKHKLKGRMKRRAPQNGLKKVSPMITISMKKACMSCYFQVNRQR